MKKLLEKNKKIIEDIARILKEKNKDNYKMVNSNFENFYNDFHKLCNDFHIKETSDPIINKLYGEVEKEVKSMITTLSDLHEDVYRINSNDSQELHTAYKDVMSLLNNIELININYKILDLLVKLPTYTQKIFIIGKNGSGKTSFANYLRKGILDNLIVIPAQKLLYYKKIYDNTVKKNLDLVLDEGFNKIKFHEQEFDTSRPSATIDLFSVAINTFIRKHISQLHDKYEDKDKEEYLFDKLRELWLAIFPDIQIFFESNDQILEFEKFNQRYSINCLSEGEKSALLYIIVSILMPKDSYIIVDEPESFLNISTSKKLWNNLLKFRDDCRFVFISHNPSFITSLSKNNNDIIWIKSFKYPDIWEFEMIQDQPVGLPRELLIEIIGNERDIIFCEGTYSSIDYKLYEVILGKNYKIIPVGGHNTVINYVKAYNDLELNLSIAYGIIDNDFKDEKACKKLERNKIKVLDVNEVEMLLLDKGIIKKVLSNKCTDDEQIEKAFNKFEEEFFRIMVKNKDTIILNKIKLVIEDYLETEKIENYSSLEEISKELEKIYSIKLELATMQKKLEDKIDSILEDKKYDELLKICNLKGAVSKGLANQYIDSNYIDKAIIALTKDQELKNYINNNYFDFFTIKTYS